MRAWSTSSSPTARARASPTQTSTTFQEACSGGWPAGRCRGRPRGSGTCAIQALELVKAKPGITIRELADSMKIKANYLYRVMPTLEQEGKVKRRDGGWHAA